VPAEIIAEVASHLRLSPGGGFRQMKPSPISSQIETTGPDMSAPGFSQSLPVADLPAVEIRIPEPASPSTNETLSQEAKAASLPADVPVLSDTSAFVNAVNQ